jgi:hypothetical protein
MFTFTGRLEQRDFLNQKFVVVNSKTTAESLLFR